MNKKEFKGKYIKIKTILDDVDPAGLGGRGEYDDIIYRFVEKEAETTDASKLASKLITLIGDELGLERKILEKSREEIAKKLDEL